MTGSRAGENWAGYTKSENVPGEDGRPVDAQYRKLWPEGTPGIGAAARRAPSAQQMPPRGLVHDAPSTPSGKRPAPRPVKPKRRRKAKGS